MTQLRMTPELWTALEHLVNKQGGFFDLRDLKDKALLNNCLRLVDFGYASVLNTGPGESIYSFSLLPAGTAAWEAHQAESE